MGLFRRRKSAQHVVISDSQTESKRATVAHLQDFVSTRQGVEAYIEPANAVTQTTVILIATTGEWTRRRVPDVAAGWKLAKELKIPAYDVNRTGYPQRMRDWNSAQKRTGRP